MHQKNWQQRDTMTDANDEHDRSSVERAREIPATDFVATVVDMDTLEPRDKQGPHWWSESVDGQCSENAALFAASQSAPLSVV